MAKKARKTWFETLPRVADKDALNPILDEIAARHGFAPDPDATIEKLRQMLLAEGVRPEDNGLTKELLRMRYGDEAE